MRRHGYGFPLPLWFVCACACTRDCDCDCDCDCDRDCDCDIDFVSFVGCLTPSIFPRIMLQYRPCIYAERSQTGSTRQTVDRIGTWAALEGRLAQKRWVRPQRQRLFCPVLAKNCDQDTIIIILHPHPISHVQSPSFMPDTSCSLYWPEAGGSLPSQL